MRAPVLCFVPKLMRTPKKPLLALLLAVLLPMQGFTFATHCASHGGHGDLARQDAETMHCADGWGSSYADNDGPRHAHDKGASHADKGASHARGCGDCCGAPAAMSITPRFPVPRAAAVLIVGRLARPHPALAIDRLDRPPRQPDC